MNSALPPPAATAAVATAVATAALRFLTRATNLAMDQQQQPAALLWLNAHLLPLVWLPMNPHSIGLYKKVSFY